MIPYFSGIFIFPKSTPEKEIREISPKRKRRPLNFAVIAIFRARTNKMVQSYTRTYTHTHAHTFTNGHTYTNWLHKHILGFIHFRFFFVSPFGPNPPTQISS